MFGRREKKLAEQLRQERELHERDLQELNKLRYELDLEKQVQSLYHQKLQDLEAQKNALAQELERRAKQQQESLEAELLRRREAEEERLRQKLAAFSRNYNYYLAQIKLLMDVLTRASITVGESFLTAENADPEKTFQSIIDSEIHSEAFLAAAQQAGPENPPAAGEAPPAPKEAKV